MNQIAIGDDTSAGDWLVLAGEGVDAPFKKAAYLRVGTRCVSRCA